MDPEELFTQAESDKETVSEHLDTAINYFYDRVGDMQKRGDVLEHFKDEFELDNRQANLLIANLVGDRVDPIIQVQLDEAYIGVVEFVTGEGWYGYKDYDDVSGEYKKAVCAQCVKEETSDNNIAVAEEGSGSFTNGSYTYEELGDRIRTHYRTHDVNPADVEVETGASLLSGTTIASNTAFHAGNDGAGSGLDADTLKGKSDFEVGVFTDSDDDNIAELSSSFTGVQAGDDCVFKLSTSGSVTVRYDSNSDAVVVGGLAAESIGAIQNQFATPSSSPQGSGVDANNSIWVSDSDDDAIFQLNQSASVISSFTTPSTTPFGIGFDTSDCLWTVDEGTASVYKLNKSGSVVSTISAPSSGPKGLGVDAGGSIWVADTAGVGGSIYQINQSGSVVTQISTPSNAVTGVGFDSNDSIWSADEGTDTIYQTNQTGSVVTSFITPSTAPAGVGVDSDICIWHIDNTTTSLYDIRSNNQSGDIFEIDRTTGNLNISGSLTQNTDI